LQRLKVSDREDPFASVIRCTADTAKADKRTRSKWSRLMRYAAVYKPDLEALDQFIQRKGRYQRVRCSVQRVPILERQQMGRGDDYPLSVRSISAHI
jgi:hypothetical protein